MAQFLLTFLFSLISLSFCICSCQALSFDFLLAIVRGVPEAMDRAYVLSLVAESETRQEERDQTRGDEDVVAHEATASTLFSLSCLSPLSFSLSSSPARSGWCEDDVDQLSFEMPIKAMRLRWKKREKERKKDQSRCTWYRYFRQSFFFLPPLSLSRLLRVHFFLSHVWH